MEKNVVLLGSDFKGGAPSPTLPHSCWLNVGKMVKTPGDSLEHEEEGHTLGMAEPRT